MRMGKAAAGLAMAVVIAGTAYYWHRARWGIKADLPPSGAVPARLGTIRAEVSATGRVVPRRDVDVRCPAGGTVVRVPFEAGDRVRQGDVVLELDPAVEEQSVALAAAALAGAEARLAQARQKVLLAEAGARRAEAPREALLQAARRTAAEARTQADRLKRLLDLELASRAEYAQAEAAAAQAEAERARAESVAGERETENLTVDIQRQDAAAAAAHVETCRLQLAAARQRLDAVRLTAPISGVVTRCLVQPGQILPSPPAPAGAGLPALTLSDVSRLFVLAGVDESDIGSVCTGQPARVTVDAYPGRVFEGRVDRVAPRGVNSAGVVTFEVRVELGGNAADLLKPEMTANVQIVTAEKAGAVLVPLDAVGEGDGRHWVRVVGAAGVESQERSVVLGLSNGEEQEIADGLKPGEWVLADGSARSGAARQGPDPPDGARRNILLPRGLR